MLLLSPNPLSGIGQVMVKYAKLLGGQVVYVEQPYDFKGQTVLAFALPLDIWIQRLKEIQKVAKYVGCMCVCETETVHPVHEQLFELFPQIMVPSEFCQKVFSRQFPKTKFSVVRHTLEPPTFVPRPLTAKKYVFYHIGNIMDHRKGIDKVVRAFTELQLPDTQLLLKATCKQKVTSDTPNVVILNGLLEEDMMNKVHDSADCYVSFSHSEGVGMGAVEAAIRDKPVIITDYGGAKEYVKTPYTIECSLTPVGVDDFLYLKEQLWGQPNYEQLKFFMKDAWEKKLRYMDHTYTKHLVSGESVMACLLQNLPHSDVAL